MRSISYVNFSQLWWLQFSGAITSLAGEIYGEILEHSVVIIIIIIKKVDNEMDDCFLDMVVIGRGEEEKR